MHHIIRPLKLISKRTIPFLLVVLTIASCPQLTAKKIILTPEEKKGGIIIPPFPKTQKWLIINHLKNTDKKKERILLCMS